MLLDDKYMQSSNTEDIDEEDFENFLQETSSMLDEFENFEKKQIEKLVKLEEADPDEATEAMMQQLRDNKK